VGDAGARLSTGRAVARGSTWQLLTFVARMAGGMGAVVLVARSGGPEQLGRLQLALTVSGLLMTCVGWGLPNLVAREVSRSPEKSALWVESTCFAALAGGAVVTALFAAGWRAVGADPQLGVACMLATASLGFDASARALFAAFWGWERMYLETLATWLQEGFYLLAALVVVWSGHGAVAVLACYLASRLLGAAAAWAFAVRGLGHSLVPRPHGRFLVGVIRRSGPFAADDLLSMSYIRADSLVLAAMKGQTAVGYYQAGPNLVLSCNVLARTLNNALYPRMSRSWPNATSMLARLRDASLRMLAATGVPIAVGSILLASQLFSLLYGPAFSPAVLCFQLLAVVIPVRMLGHTLGTALTAADAQTRRTWAVAGAAGGNIGLNFVLVPRWSYLGCAWATLITETGLLVAYAVMLSRLIGRARLLEAVTLPSAACVPMALVVVGLRGAPVLLTVLAAAAIYALALVGILTMRSGSMGGPRAAVTAYVRVAM
jgi:O-antigen/teichoic acid export membrane protein